MHRKTLLHPDRLRCIERPFAWLPCRMLTEGWLRRLTIPAKLLYLLLALAADRRGLSCFGDPRAAAELGLSPPELQRARDELAALALIAFDGQTYQLLPLPHRPAPRPPPHPQPPLPNSQHPDRRPFEAAVPSHVKEFLRGLLTNDPK